MRRLLLTLTLSVLGCSARSKTTVFIEAGHLDMGSLGGGISGFYLGVYEVSVAEYKRCVTAGQCTRPAGIPRSACNYRSPGFGAHPVDCVSVAQAIDYCEWVGGRLPSSSEWIWAAQGREEARAYPWGDDTPSCDLAATTSGEVSPDDIHQTLACSPRGTVATTRLSASASRDGVLHMFGNISEWVLDRGRAAIIGTSWAEGYYVYDRKYFEWVLKGEGLDPAEPIAGPTIGFRCAYDEPPR